MTMSQHETDLAELWSGLVLELRPREQRGAELGQVHWGFPIW